MKPFFFHRSLREKLLLLTFVLAGAILWLLNVSERWLAFSNRYGMISRTYAEQNHWLENRREIEERASRAVKNLDPGSTYNPTRLVGEISRMAGEADLTYSTDSPRTEAATEFSFHTVRLQVRRAELKSLLDFYAALSSKAPYLSLERLSLDRSRQDARLLDAVFQISSVELLR